MFRRVSALSNHVENYQSTNFNLYFQEIEKLQSNEIKADPVSIKASESGDSLKQQIMVQLQQPQQQTRTVAQSPQGTRLILIQQPNGQLLAIPASQLMGGVSGGTATIKIPPRASSAPPNEPLVKFSTHPTRPASVDAVGILRGTNGNSLRASPRSYTPSSTPPFPTPTPPMPTLEPNEQLSIRASIDSSQSEAERPELTEELPTNNAITSNVITVNGNVIEVDENARPITFTSTTASQSLPAKIITTTAAGVPSEQVSVQQPVMNIGNGNATMVSNGIIIQQAGSNASIPMTSTSSTASTKVIKKVLLKPYGVPLLPKPSGGPEISQNGMACNVKALVVCKQCGKFCHNDCISSSNVCVSCLIR